MTAKINPANVNDLVNAYISGESIYALSFKFDMSRTPIRRILLENGVTLRSHSDAGLVRASQMSDADRKAQAAAAHIAATGRKKTFAEQCLAAKTRQERERNISANERAISRMLLDRGIETIHQQAIGPYNCDLGAFPVAVEIFGGQWHWTGHHLRRTAKRFRYILNAGWNILVIPVNNVSPLTTAVADYAVTYIEQARRNPTAPREYRVIWRAGEFMTVGGLNDNDITIEPPFTSRQNPLTGQYETIPR